ncbi:MAG: acetyl-CoA synthetase [Haloferacaceae archaeon]
MDAIGDLVARERRGERLALRSPAASRAVDYHDFCTTAWKAGNALRYLGVGPGALVAVAPDPTSVPVLTFLGAAQLGAVTRFEPVADGSARVVVVPSDREGAFSLPPESKLVVYGGDPASPTVTHWEGTVWSENPSFPPTDVDPDAPALESADGRHSHADLLAAAEAVVSEFDVHPEDAVTTDAPLSDPRAVVAGVVAPLLARATVVLGGGGGDAGVAGESGSDEYDEGSAGGDSGGNSRGDSGDDAGEGADPTVVPVSAVSL